MKSLSCTIASPSEQLYSGAVASISATGSMGDLGIMPGHSPLLTQLAPGPVYLKTAEGDERVFFLSGGFMEVQPDSVSILADVGLRSEQIDEAELEAARQQALSDMSNKGDDFNYAEAAAQLANVTAQLRTIRLIRQQAKK